MEPNGLFDLCVERKSCIDMAKDNVPTGRSDSMSDSYRRKYDLNEDELIPVLNVLNDMYDPNGGIGADAARSYYYEHYASPEERKQMDAEDRRMQIIATAIMTIVIGLGLTGVVVCAMSVITKVFGG